MAVAMAVMMMVMVVMLDPNQRRLAAIVSLGPGSVLVAGRISIVRTRCFGTGRESSQQDQ
jgi:hypothetical protein